MIKQLILPLLLLPCLARAVPDDVHFLEGNLAAAQARAAREGKPYFVHFTASWCMPCQWMEQHTFTDAVLSDYVNDHYLAVKLDFDSKEATLYKKKYDVTTLPSILIFDDQGKLVDRRETSLDATTLLKVLFDNNTPQSPAKSTPPDNFTSDMNDHAEVPAMKTAYNDADGKISRPALIPDETPPTPSANINTLSQTTYIPPARTTEKPEVSAPRAPGNYAIQVGVYGEFSNAKRSQDRMERQFKKLVRIIEFQQDGKPLYRVMVGAFETQEAAEKYLLYLNNQSVRGFVKKFDN